VPFARELWIEREDFEEVPPKGFKRLTTGGEVRLRGAGIIRCDAVVKDSDGRITALHCTLDPNRARAWKAPTARSRARSTG
jgi:glutaminyl-tRNA synthetase